MEKEQFLEIIKEQFENTDPQLIKLTSEFKSLEEYDSMVALCIIAAIDQSLGVKIGGDEIRSSSTIEDLYLKVKDKL